MVKIANLARTKKLVRHVERISMNVMDLKLIFKAALNSLRLVCRAVFTHPNKTIGDGFRIRRTDMGTNRFFYDLLFGESDPVIKSQSKYK